MAAADADMPCPGHWLPSQMPDPGGHPYGGPCPTCRRPVCPICGCDQAATIHNQPAGGGET